MFFVSKVEEKLKIKTYNQAYLTSKDQTQPIILEKIFIPNRSKSCYNGSKSGASIPSIYTSRDDGERTENGVFGVFVPEVITTRQWHLADTTLTALSVTNAEGCGRFVGIKWVLSWLGIMGVGQGDRTLWRKRQWLQSSESHNHTCTSSSISVRWMRTHQTLDSMCSKHFYFAVLLAFYNKCNYRYMTKSSI